MIFIPELWFLYFEYFLVSHYFIAWLNDLQFSGKFCFPWLQIFTRKCLNYFSFHSIIVLNKTTIRPGRPRPSGMPKGNGMGTGNDHKFISF